MKTKINNSRYTATEIANLLKLGYKDQKDEIRISKNRGLSSIFRTNKDRDIVFEAEPETNWWISNNFIAEGDGLYIVNNKEPLEYKKGDFVFTVNAYREVPEELEQVTGRKYETHKSFDFIIPAPSVFDELTRFFDEVKPADLSITSKKNKDTTIHQEVSSEIAGKYVAGMDETMENVEVKKWDSVDDFDRANENFESINYQSQNEQELPVYSYSSGSVFKVNPDRTIKRLNSISSQYSIDYLMIAPEDGMIKINNDWKYIDKGTIIVTFYNDSRLTDRGYNRVEVFTSLSDLMEHLEEREKIQNELDHLQKVIKCCDCNDCAPQLCEGC